MTTAEAYDWVEQLLQQAVTNANQWAGKQAHKEFSMAMMHEQADRIIRERLLSPQAMFGREAMMRGITYEDDSALSPRTEAGRESRLKRELLTAGCDHTFGWSNGKTYHDTQWMEDPYMDDINLRDAAGGNGCDAWRMTLAWHHAVCQKMAQEIAEKKLAGLTIKPIDSYAHVAPKKQRPAWPDTSRTPISLPVQYSGYSYPFANSPSLPTNLPYSGYTTVSTYASPIWGQGVTLDWDEASLRWVPR
jgi:hypothetical protein